MKNEIGIHAIRGGAIVGEHEVIFAGKGEIIELKHTALSRDVFAAGALKPVNIWLAKVLVFIIWIMLLMDSKRLLHNLQICKLCNSLFI